MPRRATTTGDLYGEKISAKRMQPIHVAARKIRVQRRQIPQGCREQVEVLVGEADFGIGPPCYEFRVRQARWVIALHGVRPMWFKNPLTQFRHELPYQTRGSCFSA